VSKTYLPYQPTQSFLLPPSPLDWLPEDHLARFVLDTVGELDLSEIFSYYDREVRGYPQHHPMMMVALLLYAYCVGVPSSRKIDDPQDPPGAPPPSQESDLKAQMRSKLCPPEGAAVYSRFLLRGIEKVRGEWSLIALSHNLLKLHKAARRAPAMGTCVLLAA